MESYLGWKVPEANGWRIHYDHLTVDREGLHFDGLRMRANKKMVRMEVERADFGFRSSLCLTNAQIALNRNYFPKTSAPWDVQELVTSLFAKTDLAVEGGKLMLEGGEEGPLVSYFHLRKSNDKRSLGNLHVALDPDDFESRGCKIKLFAWPRQLIAEVEMNQFSMPFLDALSDYFLTESPPVWNLKEGAIDGNIWLCLGKENQVEKANALMRINNLGIENQEIGFALGGESMLLDLSYPDDLKAPAEKHVFNQASFKAQIEGGQAVFRSLETEKENVISDLNGEIRWGSFKDSEIALKGYLHHSGTQSPLVIKGSPSFSKEDTLDVGLRLFLRPDMSESTKMHLSIGMDSWGELFVKGTFEALHAQQLSLVQEIIGRRYPAILDVGVEEGCVTCALKGQFHGKRLKRLSLNVADGQGMKVRSKEFAGSFGTISGDVNLEFGGNRPRRIGDWKLVMSDGNFELEQGGEWITAKEVNLDMGVTQRTFLPSKFTGQINGIDARLECRGALDEAEIECEVAGDLPTLFRQMKLPVRGHLESLDANICCLIKRDHTRSIVEGKLSLGDRLGGGGVAHFDCILPQSLLESESVEWIEVLQGVSDGHLSSHQFHLETLNRLLALDLSEIYSDGQVEWNGEFDGQQFQASFFPHEMRIETPILQLSLGEGSGGRLTYDPQTGHYEVQGDLRGCDYFEKNTKLAFSQADGKMNITPNHFMVGAIQTEVDGIRLLGELAIDDFKSPELHINVHSVEGSVSQLNLLLNQFDHLKSLKVPFNGKVVGKEKSFVLDWHIPVENTPYCFADLNVEHVTLPFSEKQQIQDLSFRMKYDSALETVRVTELQGEVDDFALRARELNFYFAQTPYLSFDLRLEDELTDVARLAGTCQFGDEGVIVQTDSQVSHIFNNQLVITEAQVNKEGELQHCIAEYDLDLGDWRQLLSHYNRATGKEISLPIDELSGKSWIRLVYDGPNQIDATLQSDLISVNKNEFLGAYFDLAKRGSHICLDRGKFGGWIVQLDGEMEDEWICNISHLALSNEQNYVHFKEGKVHLAEKRGHLPIDWMKVDGSLWEGKGIDFIESLHFKGSAAFDLTKPRVDLRLDMQPVELDPVNLVVGTSKEIAISYAFDHLLSFGEGTLYFSSGREEDPLAFLQLSGGRVATDQRDIVVENIGWSYHPKIFDLPIFESNNPTLAAVKKMKPMKKGEWTHLHSKFKYKDQVWKVRTSFEDGIYTLYGNELDLSRLSFFHSKDLLKLRGGLTLLDKEYDLLCQYDLAATGEIVAKLDDPELGVPALYFEGGYRGDGNLMVDRLEGNFLGAEYAFIPKFQMQDAHEALLFGEVHLDISKLTPLMGEDLRLFVEKTKLKKGYTLSGELLLNKNDLSRSFFDGRLKGKDVEMFGFRLKTLMSNIHIDKECTDINHLMISDPGLDAEVNKLFVKQTHDGHTEITLPKLKIIDLRPSMLRKGQKTPVRMDPFVIRHLEFHDIHGYFDNPNTLVGRGSLHFENSFKRDLTYLDIPKEIISSLGLDLKLLVPVVGELDYELKDGKVYFRKLRNSYSDGKRSSFYLSTRVPSYVDLDGNIDMNVKMKQNVLLKLTQFFVLSVEGTLDDPSFSLK
ncbi:MAG: hypothetical protein S4CHLAM102_14740 [Chlamydiia bacterium]|nr:hypothetical protein [Chlamydiia bacterium]